MVKSYERFESTVPSWLIRDVLEPVLADLQGEKPIAIDVTFTPDGGGGWVVVHERDQQEGAGLEVPSPEASRGAEIVRWADYLQEQFFPETSAAWGEARPPCPGHPHPASAEILDDEAWWVCPSDSSRIGRIGELHKT
jgi:hypothetical protein